MFGHPVLTPLGQQIQEMPHGGKRIDTAMVSRKTRHFGGVGKMNFPAGSATEDAHRGTLAVFILRKIIVVKTAVVAGEKAPFVPAAAPAPIPEPENLHFGDQHEINLVTNVRRD